jgi:hypothetical protein
MESSTGGDIFDCALMVWLMVAIFALIAVPPKEKWLRRIPMRRWFRWSAIGALIAIGSLCVLYLGAALGWSALRSAFEFSSTSEYVGFIVSISPVALFMWLLLKYGDILVSERGIYAVYAFREWKDIADIEEGLSGQVLWLRMPERRIAWNGETFLPTVLWQLTPEVVEELRDIWAESGTPRRST